MAMTTIEKDVERVLLSEKELSDIVSRLAD